MKEKVDSFAEGQRRKFKLVVQGRNFLISGKDGVAKHGFYANRFLEASDASAAESAAIEQLRNRQSLREMTLNRRNDPPTLYVDKIVELESFDGLKSLDQGLVWYPEEEPSNDAAP